MKSLVETLNESLNINESKETMLRFEFGDLEHADETIKSIEDLANKNSVYSEKIDGGIKIKVDDSNKDKLDSIQDVLQQYVQKMQDDDKADQDDVKSLANQLDKLSDFIESEDDDEEDKENKEDKEDNEEGE